MTESNAIGYNKRVIAVFDNPLCQINMVSGKEIWGYCTNFKYTCIHWNSIGMDGIHLCSRDINFHGWIIYCQTADDLRFVVRVQERNEGQYD